MFGVDKFHEMLQSFEYLDKFRCTSLPTIMMVPVTIPIKTGTLLMGLVMMILLLTPTEIIYRNQLNPTLLFFFTVSSN